MSEPVYFLTIGLFLGTILAVAGMRYWSAAHQAAARLAHEQTYREIAASAVRHQEATAAAVASIHATLADVASRLTVIERVLQEVE